MQQAYLFFFISCFFLADQLNAQPNDGELDDSACVCVYKSLNDSTLSYDVFNNAYNGYISLHNDSLINNNILTIIDYSLSSNKKRLWVINMDSMAVLYNVLVAHGRKSGEEYAKNFSNTPNSYMSSLGFYLTDKTYYGKHGLSLYLDGMEPGINDKARQRYIVMHGADYVSYNFIRKYGRLGRSLGCPALPQHYTKAIINTIADKSCIFIHGNYPDYCDVSSFID
jgi:hypothetical protein